MRVVRKSRDRPGEPRLSFGEPARNEIGLSKTIFGKAEPRPVVQSIGQSDGLFACGRRFIGRAVEIQSRSPDGDRGKPPAFVTDLLGARFAIATEGQPLLDVAEANIGEPCLDAQIDRALLARNRVR